MKRTEELFDFYCSQCSWPNRRNGLDVRRCCKVSLRLRRGGARGKVVSDESIMVPQAEVLAYLNTTEKDEIQGSLHCATDDRTVRCFGRDDVCFGLGGREQATTERQRQRLSAPS